MLLFSVFLFKYVDERKKYTATFLTKQTSPLFLSIDRYHFPFLLHSLHLRIDPSPYCKCINSCMRMNECISARLTCSSSNFYFRRGCWCRRGGGEKNQILIDGPHSINGVPRQVVNIKWVSLTGIKIGYRRNSKDLVKVYNDSKVAEQWAKTSVAKRMARQAVRKSLSDFDRFKVAKLKKQRRQDCVTPPDPDGYRYQESVL